LDAADDDPVAVSGSRHEAEDLVQTALTNTYGRWHKIREGEALAYLRRSITNAHISRWRGTVAVS